MQIEVINANIFGVNTYLVYDETKQAILIDPSGDANKILESIRLLDVKVKYILLTHGHGDHISALEGVNNHLHVPILCHRKEVDLLANATYNMSASMGIGQITIVPDQTVTEMDTLQVGKLTFSFIHTPGHTAGGMCIQVGDALFTGDTLFQGSIGRTDLYSADPKAMEKSLRKLKSIQLDYRIFPGHGPASTLQTERERNPFLRAV